MRRRRKNGGKPAEGRESAGASGAGAAPKKRARHESSAGGVVVRYDRGEPRFLLIRDSYGHWGFPKGHVERGEKPVTAALREVMEETGARSLTVVAPITTIDWWFRLKGDLIHKHCQYFLMETLSEQTTPQLSEGITDCRWTSSAEARDLIEYENAREVLRLAGEMALARKGPSPAGQGIAK